MQAKHNLFFPYFFFIIIFFIQGDLAGQSSEAIITSKVIDQTGNALIGISIVLIDAEKEKYSTTNELGVFRFENLDEGISYRLRLGGVAFIEKSVQLTAQSSMDENVGTIVLTDKVYMLDQISVRANRVTSDQPFAYQDVDKGGIADVNIAQDLPYVIQSSPSLVVNSDGGTGIGYTYMRIRGVDQTGINVTVNGIPLNDSESQQVFWVNMPDFSSSANQIQIQRGVGTSTNGAAAFGGSVNISTLKLAEIVPSATISNSYGSFNTWKNNVQLSSGLIGTTGIALDLRLSNIQSDGYVDRASSELKSYYAGLSFQKGNRLWRFIHFSGKEVTYQAWDGLPVGLADDEDTRTQNLAGTKKPGVPHDNQVDDYMQQHYQLHFNSLLGKNTSLGLAAHFTRGKGFFELFEANEDYGYFEVYVPEDSLDIVPLGDLIQRRWLYNDFGGFTFNLMYDGIRWETTLGGALNHYEGDHFGETIWAQERTNRPLNTRYYENSGIKTDGNIFVKSEIKATDNLSTFLDVQYRHINYKIIGLDNDKRSVDQSHKFNFFNPKIGLVYSLSPRIKLFASWAVANREPNRGDFVDSAPGQIPSHETLYDTELGLRFSKKNMQYDAIVYYMDYHNQLALTGQINDVGAAIRSNIDNSYRLGLEQSFAWNITPKLNFNTNLALSINRVVEYIDRIEDFREGYNIIEVKRSNTPISFSPNIVATSELTYQFLSSNSKHQPRIGILMKNVGSQYVDNSGLDGSKLPAYTYLNLNLYHSIQIEKWDSFIDFQFQINNLTNSLYISNAWIYRYFGDLGFVEGDPSVQREDLAIQQNSLMGVYPQATRHFMAAITFRF